MSELVIIWIWGLMFTFAAIPGVMIGWVASALLGPTPGLLIVIVAAAVATIILTQKAFPGSYQMQYLMMYFPPFLLAGLLGVWASKLSSKSK